MIEKPNQAAERCSHDLAGPRGRLGGYVIRAFDHGIQGANDPDPEVFSEMAIEIHRLNRSHGTWIFRYFPETDAVEIAHHGPFEGPSDGSIHRTDVLLEVSAGDWRANGVGIVATVVDLDIAVEAAPMLQVPPMAEVDEILDEETQDRLTLGDVVATSWTPGARSAAWLKGLSAGDTTEDEDDWYDEDDELYGGKDK